MCVINLMHMILIISVNALTSCLSGHEQNFTIIVCLKSKKDIRNNWKEIWSLCEKSYRLLGLKHIASSRYSKVTWVSWRPKLPATQRGSDWPHMAIYNQKMCINTCKNSQQINTYQYMNRLLMNFKHVVLKIPRLFRYSLISATCQHDEHWTISQMSGLSHWRF